MSIQAINIRSPYINPGLAAGDGGDVANWRGGLPVLEGDRVTLRELELSDASALFAELTTAEMKRHVWAPPPNVIAFERFITWTYTEREQGKYVCFGVVPQGAMHAAGLFELRQLQPGFVRGELGFVLAHSLWGTGVFNEAARLLLDYVFAALPIHRVEARSAVDNDRGNAALRKLGARREGTLKDAFWRDDRFVDQYLWALLRNEWIGRSVASGR